MHLSIRLCVKSEDNISKEHSPLTASVVDGAGVDVLQPDVLVGVKEVILNVICILLAVNMLHKYSPWSVFLCVLVIVTCKKEWYKTHKSVFS